jgi:hypothetical protein
MHHHKLLLAILFWFIPFALVAQRTISGRITDAEKSGEPVADASVFIAGTTVGITTDAAGKYQLKIPGEGAYRLVVSHVGYESVYKDIEPGKTSKVFDIAMKTATMEEVTVSAKVRFRKYDIDLFWRTILGRKPSKAIRPVNPEAVYYYFDSSTGMLKVTCRVPLQIVNHETGYQIHYVLKYFTHDYTKNVTFWEGEAMFTELEAKSFKQKNTWEKNRKYVNSVSVKNFIKSLYNNALLDNGFLLVWERKQDFQVSETIYDPKFGIYSTTTIFKTVEGTTFDRKDSKSFLSTNSVTGEKKFYIPPEMNVMLISYGKPVPVRWAADGDWKRIGLFRNVLNTPVDPIRIFPDGSYKNWMGFLPVFESNSISGLDLVLPLDYHPDSVFTKNKVGQAPDVAATLANITQRFDEQKKVFPQEKIYLHTDKPYYLSGERIWFRAHVVDADTHIPAFLTNYVYVELYDARDSVIHRIKTGQENDFFSGYLSIPDDAPEGDYTLRAYTGGMRNLDEDYFFMKNIHIADPMSRMIQALPEFHFTSDQQINTGLRFSRIYPVASITPESVKISINNDKPMNVKCENGVSGISFSLLPGEKQRTMLLDAICDKHPYRQYIRIPFPDTDFDVSFYPEGGSALYGVAGCIAFKAMQRDGTEIDVDGVVYNRRGTEITRFKTDIRGMGQFAMLPDAGETYYAVCTNSKGQSKRFDLPVAKKGGYALSASWFKGQLIVQVYSSGQQSANDTLCLLVHTRGIVQEARIWKKPSDPIVFQKDFFPSGVTHLLLLNKDMTPVSERLVFVHHDDQAKVTGKPDKDAYPVHSPVEFSVNITNESGEPVRGNISVAVTDDHEVATDTVSNILTSLLLTSDLRGNIPEPAYFFRKNKQSSYVLDLLMLTQGWRRYDVERIIRNDLIYPDTLIEKGYEITGTVKNANNQRPVKSAEVSVLSMKGGYSETTATNRNGRFYLSDGGINDGIPLVVQTSPKLGRQNLELMLDKPSYPERSLPVAVTGPPARDLLAIYADKAEQQYVDENGERVVHLEEITVTGQKKTVDYSYFYKSREITYSITEDDLEKNPAASISSLLMRIPNIWISNNKIIYGYNRLDSLILYINNMQERNHGIIEMLTASDIVQVDFLSGSVARGMTGFCNYAINIHTKKSMPNRRRETPYIKHFIPLGIQKPAEFYAPKYDTPAGNQKPDLRTTIHWAPNITTNEEGKASFSFYTADTPSTYTVVIEGITEDGKIVYKRDKIVVGKQ